MHYQYIDLKLHTRSSSAPVCPQTELPSLQEGEHPWFGCSKEAAEKTIFLPKSSFAPDPRQQEVGEVVTERFKSVPGRLQTRTCNSTPEAALLLSGEVYIVHQRYSSPPASHCNMTTKKNEIQSCQEPLCTATMQTAWAVRPLLVWALFHLGEPACSPQLTWASLLEISESAQWRLAPALFLAALQLMAISLRYHKSTLWP